MSIFTIIKQWRNNTRIDRLEAQLQGRPLPNTYLELADAYTSTGNSAKAVQILKLGMSRYPGAVEITRRHNEAEKIRRQGEIKRLTEKIKSHPNPILYARLAEVHKADHDIDRSIQVCEAGIKAFPKYGGVYLVLGQIYAEKEDWKNALEYLEKSVELDRYNYMALKRLAEIYIQLERFADAARKLEDILYFAPGDEKIRDLLNKVKNKEGDKPAPTSSNGDEHRNTRTRVEALAASSAKDNVLNTGISALSEVPGTLGAILVDQYGLVVAAKLDASLDEALAGALITNIFRTVSGNASKLGVGNFEEGIVECDLGNIHVALVNEMILAVFASNSVKLGLLETKIRDFVMAVLEKH